MRLFSWSLLLIALPFLTVAQHTFSIVAIDSITGEIGSAGATCGDDITWPGTGGAILISDILPGVGAIHTQSFYLEANQNNARQQMETGASPNAIIDWLVANDIQNNPSQRQYGIAGYTGTSISAAAYTGNNCLDEKGHRVGPNYSIQGNILKDETLLDSMEQAFLSTPGPLSDRLMAAMQAANVPGADSRCLIGGVSSLSAFLRVARSDDLADNLWLDLNIPFTPSGTDPIDALQTAYDNWKTTASKNLQSDSRLIVSPQPASSTLLIEFQDNFVRPDRIRLYDQQGVMVLDQSCSPSATSIHLEIGSLQSGLYILVATSRDQYLVGQQVTIVR